MLLLSILGYTVLSVLVSYFAIRLYRSRGSCSKVLPTSLPAKIKSTSWNWHKSLLWSRPNEKKPKLSKHLTVELLPITGLPPPPTALPSTSTPPPPLVDIPSASSTPRIPSPPIYFHQHVNKQIQSLHPTSFSRPPSPHALLATTTSPQKLPRRSRSLGGVPVRRLSGGTSGLRNVQILDTDLEFSSGSSDELDALQKDNEEGVISRRISPVSSDIGVLPSRCRPSLFDDAADPLVNLDLAPGRKVVQLVDLADIEDGLGVKHKEDAWKWFESPMSGKIHLTSHEATPASISISIFEPLPISPPSLPLSQSRPIDFHSAPEQEHVLVDLHVHDNSIIPQPEFIHTHRTCVNPMVVAVDYKPTMSTIDVKSLDEPPIVRSGKVEAVLAIDDHHDDYTCAYDMRHHTLRSFDTLRGEELQSLSSSHQIAPISTQAAPVWYWDHEDDPWNGTVGVGENDVEEGEDGIGEELLEKERGGKVEKDDEREMDVSQMEVDLKVGEDEDTVKTLHDPNLLELSVELSLEDVPTRTEDEGSCPDPDYLPLPELLLGSSPSQVPLVLVENVPTNNFQEDDDADENENGQDEDNKQLKESPRRVAQMPTPPASPPTSVRVRGLGIGTRSGPPSPNSLSSMRGLLLSARSQSTSPKLSSLLSLTPPNTSSPSPVMELQMKISEGGKDDAGKSDEGDEVPDKPLWSIRAGDAPVLGLSASSLSISTSTSFVGTSMRLGTKMKKVLGDITAVVENGGEREVEIKKEVDVLKGEKEKEEADAPPGAFPELLELLKPTSSSDTNTDIAPTITTAALTGTLLSTSVAAASSIPSTSTSETPTQVIQRRSSQPIVRSPLDIALAMQLRPGLGVGADPAWMVRFLMSMFGWFAILVSGQGEF